MYIGVSKFKPNSLTFESGITIRRSGVGKPLLHVEISGSGIVLVPSGSLSSVAVVTNARHHLCQFWVDVLYKKKYVETWEVEESGSHQPDWLLSARKLAPWRV